MIEGKTYLSGPMNSQKAVDQMFRVARLLKDKQIDVINPADVPYGKTYYSHLPAEGLRNGLCSLTESENIVLIPGWKEARGCIIEMFTAALIGTKMFTVNEIQLEKDIILLEKYEIPLEQLNKTVAQLLLTQNETYELKYSK